MTPNKTLNSLKRKHLVETTFINNEHSYRLGLLNGQKFRKL
ncbi:hypothetical protein VPMS16_2158 [Vibrio sp. 16]|nr:hypothetical protein VPMS16_2158 [Vibrio sp. 16]